MCLGEGRCKGYNTGLVEGTLGELMVHGLGGAILAFPQVLESHTMSLNNTINKESEM